MTDAILDLHLLHDQVVWTWSSSATAPTTTLALPRETPLPTNAEDECPLKCLEDLWHGVDHDDPEYLPYLLRQVFGDHLLAVDLRPTPATFTLAADTPVTFPVTELHDLLRRVPADATGHLPFSPIWDLDRATVTWHPETETWWCDVYPENPTDRTLTWDPSPWRGVHLRQVLAGSAEREASLATFIWSGLQLEPGETWYLTGPDGTRYYRFSDARLTEMLQMAAQTLL